MTMLGVNIDHVATIRQARRAAEPDPVAAAIEAEFAGAHGITVHLRGDRRHIQDRDVRLLRETVTTRLNVEMALSEEMIGIAVEVRPDTVTLVPERETEITTEGGLDLRGTLDGVRRAVERLDGAGIEVSLFIDPHPEQIEAAVRSGASVVELNTAAYAEAVPKGIKLAESSFLRELGRVQKAAEHASSGNLRVLAGHGLTYRNVRPVSDVFEIEELNIGHNIVARAALVGIREAVQEMLMAMNG